MHGRDILCGISKVSLEIPHKISYSYIQRCAFYLDVKIWELLDLRAHKLFWNAPRTFSRIYSCGGICSECTMYVASVAM